MPRKPKSITPEADRAAQFPVFVTPAPPPPPPPTGAVEERRERELDELIEAIGTDGRLTVWHIIDGKAVFAGNMTLDGFSLQTLLETFGGGDKSLVFYQGKQKVDTFRVSLDPSIPPTSPARSKVAVAAPAPNGAATPAGDVATLITAMANAQLASMQSMASMQQASNQNMQTLLAGLTATLSAQPKTDPVQLVTTILSAVKDHGAPSATTPTKELLDMFERGLNISERLTGHDGDDVTSIVGKGVETLGVLIEGIVAEKKANAARIIAGAPSGTVESNSDAFAGDGTEHIGTSGSDAGAGGVLPIPHNGAAANVALPTGADDTMATATRRPAWAPDGFSNITVEVFNWLTPDEAAALIQNRLSDEQFDMLLDDIEAPGFAERLVQYFPAAARVDPQWIGALITILLTDTDADADESASATGET